MKIIGFIWHEQIVEKINKKHNVRCHEIEEIFVDKTQFRFIEKGFRNSEDVYAALGKTNAGRFLVVFFIYKKDHYALILSARDMTRGEKNRYEKK